MTWDEHTAAATAPEPLRFGRASDNDLLLGSDRSLHRWQGRFDWAGGQWWLHNLGTRTPLHVQDVGSSSSLLLSPGQSAAMVFTHGEIRFSTQRKEPYRLIVTHDAPPPKPQAPQSSSGDSVTEHRVVPLRDDHLLLVLALAEPQLRNPAAPATLPANKEVAARFGWKPAAYNSKLAKICAKFERAGVAGLRGSNSTVAADRRVRLVEHLIRSELVTVEDLVLLEDHPPKS